ncbi:MAG: hypothetical protein RL719_725, partial [Actinomycetota bacterium]
VTRRAILVGPGSLDRTLELYAAHHCQGHQAYGPKCEAADNFALLGLLVVGPAVPDVSKDVGKERKESTNKNGYGDEYECRGENHLERRAFTNLVLHLALRLPTHQALQSLHVVGDLG